MNITRLSIFTLLSLVMWGCPEDPAPGEPPTEKDMGDTGGSVTFDDMNPGGEETGDMGGEELEPMEADPCSLDSECFPGRICVEASCQDAECQEDTDCPASRPVCFGEEGEEPGQRRGRCGDCASDDECYGQATCVPFEGAGEESAEGLCELTGNCEGSLECSPSSTRVIRGPQSEVCLDRRSSDRDPICQSAFNCQEDDQCPEGLRCLDSGQCATSPLNEECDENIECGFGQVCRMTRCAVHVNRL